MKSVRSLERLGTEVASHQNHRFVALERIWLTVEDAAAYLCVKPGTIYNWKCSGKIKAYKIGGATHGAVRFLKEDLDAVVKGSSYGKRHKKKI